MRVDLNRSAIPKAIYFNAPSNPFGYQKATIKLMGAAIKAGSIDPRIRNIAARAAAKSADTTGRKNFAGQAKAVFDDFVKRWRYVWDPLGVEMLSATPDAIYRYVLAGDGIGLGDGYGAGDCDCAAIALGSLYRSIGFPVRIATTARLGKKAGPLMAHVFAQISIPGYGWVTTDPVPYPEHGFGFTPTHSRIAYYDLNGQRLGASGNYDERFGDTMFGSEEMTDMGFGGIGLDPTNDPEAIWDWRRHGGIQGFGAYSDELGIVGNANHLLAEVTTFRNRNGDLIARTPMIEMAPLDHIYTQTHGAPYDGCFGLGDDGTVYTYSGLDGFFKKLFQKGKKLAGKIRSKARKLLKKTKFGKYLVKFGDKVHAVAMKFVKPLIKFVGKYAAKLAPVAALIPGWGTAVAAGLATAGKIAKLMTKYGVAVAGKKGEARVLAYRDPESAKAFQAELNSAAEEQAQILHTAKGQAANKGRRQPIRQVNGTRRVVRRTA